MAISHLARLQELQGLLHKAEETYQVAVQITKKYKYPLPLSCMADIGLGNLLCERNNLERAKVHLRKGVDLGHTWSHWEALVSGYIGLARVAMAKGNNTEANELLDEAVEGIRESQLSWLPPLIEAHQAIFRARQGDLKAAAEWSQKCGIDLDQPIEFNQGIVTIPLARVWIALQKCAEARQLIAQLIRLTLPIKLL